MKKRLKLLRKIINLIKNFYTKNFLVKVASINILSVLARFFSGFIVSKVSAIFIGPSGIAITGNLSNIMQSIESLTSLGVKNGIIKYVSENKEDKTKLKFIISSAFTITLIISILLFIFLFFFSSYLSFFVFKHINYSYLFKISALMMPFYSFHIFFISVMNGMKQVSELVKINVLGYFLTTIIVVFLIITRELNGALLAIIVIPILLFCSLFYKYSYFINIIKLIDISFISKEFLNKIASFFSMSLFSGIMFPVIFLFIRNYIIDNVGLNEAGYWEATRKISNYYMLFIYAIYDMYLLPTLSEDTNSKSFKSNIFNFYKHVLPIVLVLFITIYSFRFLVIKIVFTDQFLGMHELFCWQLFGDFFKIISFTIAYQFSAKRMIKLYIACEAVYLLFIYLSSIHLIDYYGVIGAVKAHAYSYIFYTLLMFFIFRKKLFKKDEIT